MKWSLTGQPIAVNVSVSKVLTSICFFEPRRNHGTGRWKIVLEFCKSAVLKHCFQEVNVLIASLNMVYNCFRWRPSKRQPPIDLRSSIDRSENSIGTREVRIDPVGNPCPRQTIMKHVTRGFPWMWRIYSFILLINYSLVSVGLLHVIAFKSFLKNNSVGWWIRKLRESLRLTRIWNEEVIYEGKGCPDIRVLPLFKITVNSRANAWGSDFKILNQNTSFIRI